ncbi:unnamed protein product [Rhizopus stolonifer]
MLTTESRKRTQNTNSALSWTDFIYSSPPSPSTEMSQALFDTHFQHSVDSGSNSRRHSVAFGEFDYHSIGLNTLSYGDEKPVHKRSMSLKEDDNTLFLESWMLENSMTRPRELSMDSSIISDFSFSDLSTTDLFKFGELNPTINPSETMTNEINSMADWLLEQPQKRQKLDDSPMGSSSSSLSPPVTPIQPDSLGFDFIEQDSISLQFLIQSYLLKQESHIPGERTIMLLTSKVAQKSYGTEKRFLCPPPATILKGNHWLASDSMADKNLDSSFHSPSNAHQAPKLTIQISGETIQQSGIIEWQTSSGTLDATQSKVVGKCISKQLYINDADEKRKRVEVLAKVQLGNGLTLGTFQSKGIKVISKPSKKRQNAKNMELCVHHGTTISLFNRIRSQTVSTKYLGVSVTNDSNNNGTCFVSRTGVWDPFVIWIVDTSPNNTTRLKHNPHNPDYPPPPAIALQSSSSLAIHYNQPVVLQCVTTGLVSPVMIIRKVDKQSLVLGGNLATSSPGDGASFGGEAGDEVLGDPVSQLHKVAFQIVQDPAFHSTKIPRAESCHWQIPFSSHPVTYLACLNEVVGMHKTTSTRHLVSQCQDEKENGIRQTKTSQTDIGLEGACWTEDVSDAAVWTIVGTDCASYTFWTPDERLPSLPFPIIHEVTQKEDQLMLSGENLSSDIDVWFGDIQSLETKYTSHNTIHCKIPNVTNSVTIEQQDHTKKIPLLLVRSNGVVYKTNFYYTL